MFVWNKASVRPCMTRNQGFQIVFDQVTFQLQFQFDFLFYFLIHADLLRTKTWMQPKIKSGSHLTEKKRNLQSFTNFPCRNG